MVKKSETKVVPSIIGASQKEIDEMITRVSPYVSLMQLDIMDGKFVKNKSFWFDFRLPKKIWNKKMKYEAHLMVKEPERWIKKHLQQVDTVVFPYESLHEKNKTKEKERILSLIKKINNKKKKAGIAINPKTKAEKIFPYLKDLDQVTILAVHPGGYGAKFLPKMLKKVREIRKRNKRIIIEVDGGINPQTVKLAAQSGANYFVSGSFVTKAEKPGERIAELKKQLTERLP
ncbi:MAG TPA: ribulose-phosphate 3-epimerase [Candidatus Nanoarchaeia archaeon]|nr:ribulose-phosphate 3-epimerase [Candidatus Nanoarchaeia archaeon]